MDSAHQNRIRDNISGRVVAASRSLRTQPQPLRQQQCPASISQTVGVGLRHPVVNSIDLRRSFTVGSGYVRRPGSACAVQGSVLDRHH